ncbi:MAG: hypothetical protein II978_01135 [Clostridia bacterium]|nr:hypothetical protein [Clostridia bacterium]
MAEGFKNSFMGFCKQDVLDYIQKLSANYAVQLAEKDEEIESLRAKNKELKTKLRELEKKE